MSDEVKVKYAGPWCDYTGYGEANRNAIMALHTVGVDVTTERISYTPQQFSYGKAYDVAAKLEAAPVDYGIKIIHVPSDGYLRFLEPTKYHIGHLFWETDGLSKSWVWNCNLVNEIWTGGEWHKENFRRAGVKVPINVYPQSIDTTPFLSKKFTIPDHKGFLFYSIFQWIERKNPKALLTAYWQEFEGEENVSLLIKTYGIDLTGESFQKIRSDIKAWKAESGVKSFPRTMLYTQMLSKEDIMRIHITGDCFVSAHRGEGWGIPQVEAMSVGNPIISTNLGGVHEWLEDEKNAFLLKYTMSNVKNMEFAPWYNTDQRWADVAIPDIRKKMRFVFENRDKAKEIGMAGKRLVDEKFSYKSVGELMKRRLQEIQKQL